jgi:hypothetical protein
MVDFVGTFETCFVVGFTTYESTESNILDASSAASTAESSRWRIICRQKKSEEKAKTIIDDSDSDTNVIL